MARVKKTKEKVLHIEKVLLAFLRGERHRKARDELRTYTILCDVEATKKDVAAAVSKTYGVEVQSVRTLLRRGHHKMAKRKWKGRGSFGIVQVPTRKVAYVTLRPGNSIPLAFTEEDLQSQPVWQD